jgi:putative oxidoreductase
MERISLKCSFQSKNRYSNYNTRLKYIYNFLSTMKNTTDLIGRILLSFIFFFEAYDSMKYVTLTKRSMTAYHIVWHQDLLLWGSVIVLLLGATMLLLGYRVKLGAFLLLLYWIPLTFILYQFWKAGTKPALREMSQQFMKNMAIAGGLLMVFANGSGRYSMKRLLATTTVSKTVEIGLILAVLTIIGLIVLLFLR